MFMVIAVMITALYMFLNGRNTAACPVCPPCKEYKCTITNPSEPLPQVAPPVAFPPASQTALNPIPGRPTRPYIHSGDTAWHELGFVNSEGTKRRILRLFGRRRFPRSERFEYFLSTKDGISIPFSTPKGVELMNGDKVDIPGFDDKFIAVIFPVDAPRYSPTI